MNKKILAWLLALMMLISGVGMAETASIGIIGGADGPTSIFVAGNLTDGLGRAVEIPESVETIVSLTPANTEILYALGMGEKIVGADSYSDWPADALEIPRMGDYSGPNVELIVAANPDVVFASTTLQIDAIDTLESLGMTVVCVEPTSFESITSGIALIALVVGADPAPLIEEMELAKAAALSEIPADAQPLKVYFALSFGEYGDYSAGPGTFIDEMIAMAGATNVAADAEYAWPIYSLEGIIAADPDAILVSDYAGDGSILEQFESLDVYKELRAVKEGRVYAVTDSLVSRPGPRIVDGLAQIVTALYAQ